MATLQDLVNSAHSHVFRRFQVKRRLSTTGLFETDWQDLTMDVIQWGQIRNSVDSERPGKVSTDGMKITVANDTGRYNPEDNSSSFWFGYSAQQRTLIRIQAGFVHHTLASSGIWINTEFPTTTTVFTGIIQGNFGIKTDNTVDLNIQPLQQVFIDFAAGNLSFSTPADGLTFGKIMTAVWNMTDGAGGFVFRPFFGDTLSNFVINESGIQRYRFYSSGTEPGFTASVQDLTLLDLLEKTALCDNRLLYVRGDGRLTTIQNGPSTSQGVDTNTSWYMGGSSIRNTEISHNIKQITKYGLKISNYYSKVSVSWGTAFTNTSVGIAETSLTVSPTNAPWKYGAREYRIENKIIYNQSLAVSSANLIHSITAQVPIEIELTTSFMPHIAPFTQMRITNFESAAFAGGQNTFWDLNYWADASESSTELYWAKEGGDSISLDDATFQIKETIIDLDTFECRIRASTATAL